jgi:beta-lactamase superfamily II metal-dependent hydrolase
MPKKAGTGKRKAAGADQHVRIRMYNVGFGDCFLMFIPTSDGEKKVLVDCGSIKQGSQPLAKVVDKLIADVTDEDGKAAIDLLIATHRHRDHVSGFANAVWDEVDVKEIWMPWTEKPGDPEAQKIRDAQNRLALALQAAFTRLGADQMWLDLAANASVNERAMTTLHEGFKGKPNRRFLPEKDRDKATFEPEVLAGVTVHIMGPSRDPDVIRNMDPPAGQSYLRLLDPGALDSSAAPEPFSPDWALEQDDFKVRYPHLRLTPKDLAAAREAGTGLEETLGAALDSAINGTSLMIMFRVGHAYLLFPGDAQWGTWKVALEDPKWKGLLKRTGFYKIGHHGSHNATPLEFVEKVLGDDFQAMASVKPTANWKEIPREPLLEALRKKNKRVIRSDKLDDVKQLGFTSDGQLYVDAVVPLT